MLFEADGIRQRESLAEVTDRVNPGRLEWYREYRQRRRPANSLETFIRDDAMFKKSADSVMDAYSQAWALSFYLAETRPMEFARYLKVVSSRNPLEKYDGDDRVKDFRTAFGHDLEIIETGMLRFYDRLGR